MSNINIHQICANNQAFKNSLAEIKTAFDSNTKWISGEKNSIAIKQKNWRITRIIKKLLSVFGDTFSKVRSPKIAKNLLVYCAMNQKNLDPENVKIAVSFLKALNLKTKGKYESTLQAYAAAIHMLTPLSPMQKAINSKTAPILDRTLSPNPQDMGSTPGATTTTPGEDANPIDPTITSPEAPMGNPPPPPPAPKGPIKLKHRGGGSNPSANPPTASPTKAKPAAPKGSPMPQPQDSPLYKAQQRKNGLTG